MRRGYINTDEEVGDDSGEYSEELGQDGEPGPCTGYISDSNKLRSSEWWDGKNDIVFVKVSGDGTRMRGGLSSIGSIDPGVPRRGMSGNALTGLGLAGGSWGSTGMDLGVDRMIELPVPCTEGEVIHLLSGAPRPRGLQATL